MKVVVALACVLGACTKPPPPPVVVPPPVIAAPTAPAIERTGRCTDGEPHKLDATWTISIDECDLPKGDDEHAWTRMAHLVRRLTPTTGHAWELDTWTQHREGGKSWQIEGVLRDRTGAATKVLLVSRQGGLDEAGSAALVVYEVATDHIDHTKVAGETIDVVVAADATVATVTTCSSEAMYIDLENPVACKDEPTAKIDVVEIR